MRRRERLGIVKEGEEERREVEENCEVRERHVREKRAKREKETI